MWDRGNGGEGGLRAVGAEGGKRECKGVKEDGGGMKGWRGLHTIRINRRMAFAFATYIVN